MRRKILLRILTCLFLLLSLAGSHFVVSAQSKKDIKRAEKLATEGNKLYDDKDYKEAIIKYAQSLTLVPNQPRVRYFKGYSHYNLQQYDQAISEWNTALTQGYTPQIEIYKIRSYAYFVQKNYDQALVDALKGVELAPNDLYLNLVLGDIYRFKNSYRDSLAAYRKATQIDPANADVYYFVAVCHFNLGEHISQGINAFEAIKRGTQWLAESYNLAGDALQKDKKYDQAVEAYKKALIAKPELYPTYHNLADVYRNMNRLDDAINITNQGIAKFPNDGGLYIDLGWYLSLANRHEESIQASTQAIKFAPNNYMGYTNLCRAYDDLKQYQKAIENCNEALKINPNDGETNFYLGFAYQGLKNEAMSRSFYEKSVNGLVQLTRNNPDYADGFYLLGNAYYSTDKTNNAIEAYKRCLQISPGFTKARFNLGLAYFVNGDLNSARAQYNALLTIDKALAEELRQTIDLK